MLFWKINKTALIIIAIFLLVKLNNNMVIAGSPGEVKIGNQVIFRFQDDGKSDPVQRSLIVQSRIDELLGSSLGPSDIRLKKNGSGYRLFWGSDLITIIDPAQARLNNTTSTSLAKSWQRNFIRALSNIAFFLVPARIEMPVHSTIKVKAGGIVKGEIIKEYDAGNISVSINQETEEISVRSNGVGESKVVFRRGGMRAPLLIKILDNPATIRENIKTEVSGDPAPKEVLQYAASNACRNAIILKPGAKIEIDKKIRVARKLGAGRKIVAHVPVIIYGKNYFTIKKEVPVSIYNRGSVFKDIKILMVSDRPEAFNKDGVLFKGKFNSNNPTRLLYFHQNADRKPRRFWIELKNNTNEIIHVMTGGALGGPSRWGVTVGHMAAMRFLEMYQNAIGYTIQIPPGQSVSLIDLEMQKQQVLCGYFHLNIRKGKELEVYVKNSEKLDGVANGRILPILTQPFDPFKIHPKGIFGPANIENEVEYVVGQEEEASCIVGQAPWLIDPVTGEPNNGNYGVFYRFKVKLRNPTSEKKRIGFYFVPQGVLARGSFILDGKIMETGMIRFPSRAIFAIIDLEPKSKKELTLLTTPEGGSYYPIKVVITTVESPPEVPRPDTESGTGSEDKEEESER